MALVPKREDFRPHKDPLERPDMILAFGTHDTSFRPGDPYLTAFAEGRRHAGTTIIYMLNSAPTRTDPDKIATRNPEQPDD
jgi:hypothetical protein